MPQSVAARLFGVSLSSVKRYARIIQRGLSLVPRREEEGHRRPTRPRTNSSKVKSRSVQPLLWQKGVAS